MRKPQIYILKGLQVVARGRGAISTTTPGWEISWIRTLKGVPETLGPPRIPAPSATHYRGRILSFARFPGCSSLSLLDPGLQSPIPAGIKNRTAEIQSLKALAFSPGFLVMPEFVEIAGWQIQGITAVPSAGFP